MSWQIKKADIPLLAMGAKLIACGGGGNPITIQNLLMSCMNDQDTITVKTIADLKDELVVGTGMMGSTVFYNENIPSGWEGSEVLKRYESSISEKIGAIIPVEIGGINGLDPLFTAFQNNLPVVDGDGMGKAFPELAMTTFHLHQIPVLPLVLQAHNSCVVFQGQEDIKVTSEKAKKYIAENGGYVHFAGFAAHAKKMKSAMIPGSLNLIYRLGAAVVSDKPVVEKWDQILTVFENSLYGKPIHVINGVVTDVNRWFESAALIGTFTVEGRTSFPSKRVDIEFRNEFVSINGICTTPDLILVLDDEKLSPYSVSEIQEGLSVTILAVPAPNILRTKEMLNIVGPQNFNLKDSYQPLQGDQQNEARN
jgi:uncharacterized protein